MTDDGRPDGDVYAELHAELMAEYATETEAWAVERLARVMARLNEVRRGRAPLRAHCLWLPAFAAFTMPGREVYVSRQLLERMPSDETAAFVLAHETAHHDLGHLRSDGGWLDRLPRGGVGSLAAAAVWQLGHRLHGPERELHADRYALALCIDAGYRGQRCLQAFDILANESLNRGDVDGVFGPADLLDPEHPGRGSVAREAQRWLWTRVRGYLPLRERRERAWEFYRGWCREQGAP